MVTPVHIISASLIALKASHVAPDQINYIVMALIFSGIIDFDHIFYLIRDYKYYQKHGFKGHLHHARSPLHELVGVIVFSVISLIMYFFDKTMSSLFFISIMVHLAQDFLTGISMPFAPFDKREMKLFEFTFTSKVITNVLTTVIFIILWTLYLSGNL